MPNTINLLLIEAGEVFEAIVEVQGEIKVNGFTKELGCYRHWLSQQLVILDNVTDTMVALGARPNGPFCNITNWR